MNDEQQRGLTEMSRTSLTDNELSERADVFADSSTTAEVRDGAARDMLADFYVRQLHGKAHSNVTLNWLAEVIDATLERAKDSPYWGFGLLSPGKGRPKLSGQDWTPRVAAVELLSRADTKLNALAVVAAVTGNTDTRRLEKAAAGYDLRNLDHETLTVMAGGVLPGCVRVIRERPEAYPELAKWLSSGR